MNVTDETSLTNDTWNVMECKTLNTWMWQMKRA